MPDKTLNKRWLQLITGALSLLFAGVIYAWSILKAPFASEFNWSSTTLGLNYTIAVCFFCIGGFICGLLVKKLSLRVRIIIAAVLFFTGFFGVSRITADSSPALLCILYGVTAGTGIGFVYNSMIGLTNAWFPDKKGLCSGLMMMTFGFSSLVIGKAADYLMSPDVLGWRTMYVVLAASASAVLLITSFIVKLPPAGMKFPAPKNSAKKNTVPARDYSAVEMVKTLSFWKAFVYVLLLAASGSAAISFAKDIIADAGGGESLAVTMVGVLSVFNGLGRLISGALIDKLGIRRAQYITNTIAVAAPLVIVLGLTTSTLVFGIIGLCMCGFSYGCAPTASATYASVLFGQKNFSLNFGIINLILIPASFASTVAGSLKVSTGSFVSTFIILAVCCALNFAVGLSIKLPQK